MKYTDKRKEEMYRWFHDSFSAPELCDTAMVSEHGTEYVCGGSYTALEILTNAFGQKYPPMIIGEVAADLETESHEWIVKGEHVLR